MDTRIHNETTENSPLENRNKAQNNRNQPEFANLVLVGNANVGKSVIFGLLTGKYVVVSNYPGTTVEITRGTMNVAGRNINIIDTPGVANLIPMSSDEVVTRNILLDEKQAAVLQVADSKNIARTLSISLQLAEMGVPFLLALNMADEARERRITIHYSELAKKIGVPVVPTIAVSRTGIDQLKASVPIPAVSTYSFKYNPIIESAIDLILPLLPEFAISGRSLAVMLLSEDQTIYSYLCETIDKSTLKKIEKIVHETRERFDEPIVYIINQERMKAVDTLVSSVAVFETYAQKGLAAKIGNLSMHPLWGYPVLLAVLVFMYYFVGQFAAGTIVDYFQDIVFGEYLIPWMTFLVEKTIPITLIREALVGNYGILSVGLTYALAIVLPIVAAFFLFFGILEDSGYLPRLAILANRGFKAIGLNGKAILPMVLGLGCGTMAAISARILDSKKEQLMVLLLLALGIPCSAQLGVIMGLIAGVNTPAFLIWLAVVISSLLIVGYAANKVLPGDCSDFIMEIPPLRIPSWKNIIVKTLARIEWYLREALPLFMLATFTLFLIDKLNILAGIETLLRPIIVGILGLPESTAQVFLVSFLRRDFGAASFLDLAKSGTLNANQVLVSMVVVTLFLPCLAQLLVMIKERSLKSALGIAAFVLVYAFFIGGLVNLVLNLLGVKL